MIGVEEITKALQDTAQRSQARQALTGEEAGAWDAMLAGVGVHPDEIKDVTDYISEQGTQLGLAFASQLSAMVSQAWAVGFVAGRAARDRETEL